MTHRLHTAVALLGASVLALGTASAAHGAPTASTITCGEDITVSVTLNKNLTCPGTAFQINTTGITVNLGGHTVTTTDVARYTIQTHTGTNVIADGTIAGAMGVDDNFSANIYTNLTFNKGGLTIVESTGAQIGLSTFTNGAGVFNAEGTATIGGSRFVHGPAGKAAIASSNAETTIEDNVITGYGPAIAAAGTLSAIHVQDNTVTGARNDGITVGGGAADQVVGTITDNTFNKNAGDGIAAEAGSGIPTTSAQTPGLFIEGNTTNFNAGDGIHIDPAGGGGINVTLADNFAASNGNYGIGAPKTNTGPPPITVTDFGGDIAKSNGQKTQCANIVCIKS